MDAASVSHGKMPDGPGATPLCARFAASRSLACRRSYLLWRDGGSGGQWSSGASSAMLKFLRSRPIGPKRRGAEEEWPIAPPAPCCSPP